MKKVWVVSLRTSLPGTGYSEEHLKKTVRVFDSFEKAAVSFRKTIREYAFADNSMFDGDGRMKQFDNYLREIRGYEKDEEGDYYDGVITAEKLEHILDVFEKLFAGENAKLRLDDDDECCTDWMIAFEYKDGVIRFYGDDDGPCNGYDPTLTTNIFSMEERENYFLYIDDRMGQDENPSQFFIDLTETTLEED